MAIRLRTVDGMLVALCAARSIEKEGDVYIDDGQHQALAEKFWRDYEHDTMLPECPEEVASIVDREESNNANRAEWDRWMERVT